MALQAFRDELASTAAALAAPGTGLLAADESTGTIGKRFDAIDLENSEENRRAYRSLLATTPGLSDHISGVILFEETLFQDSTKEAGGTPITELFQAQGIVPGIKVDQGVEPLAGGLSGETWCTGLKGLAERAARYYERGARFAKWRAVLQISANGSPSELSVRENAWGLARYARTVQEQGLVPIVEPEILMDGDHDITTTAAVQEWVLRTTYEALAVNGVFLEGSLDKLDLDQDGNLVDENAMASAAKILQNITAQQLIKALTAGQSSLKEQEESILSKPIEEPAAPIQTRRQEEGETKEDEMQVQKDPEQVREESVNLAKWANTAQNTYNPPSRAKMFEPKNFPAFGGEDMDIDDGGIWV